jgi:hypothetical protein
MPYPGKIDFSCPVNNKTPHYLLVTCNIREKRDAAAYFDNLMWAILQCMCESVVGVQ